MAVNVTLHRHDGGSFEEMRVRTDVSLVDNLSTVLTDVLNDLTDVNAGSPSDGQGLVWDSTTSKWIAGDVAANTDGLVEETGSDLMTGSLLWAGDQDYKGIYWGSQFEDVAAHVGAWAYIRQGATQGQLEIGSDQNIDIYETDARVLAVQINTNNKTLDAKGGLLVDGENINTIYEPKNTNIQTHIGLIADNPHGVTYANIGGTQPAPISHAHGYINNAGSIITGVTIAEGDYLAVIDADATCKLGRGITFTSNVSKFLREDGSWQTPSYNTLELGETSSTAYRGDRGKTAYDHSQVAHAPSDAQAHIAPTKAEVEAVLTGVITSHSHSISLGLNDLTGVSLSSPSAGHVLLYNGSTWVNAVLTGYSDEKVRDAIGTALVGGTNITVTVDDPNDTITIDNNYTYTLTKAGVEGVLTGAITSHSHALPSHTHGNITNDGKIGTTANRVIVTTTDGLLTTEAQSLAFNKGFGYEAGTIAEGLHLCAANPHGISLSELGFTGDTDATNAGATGDAHAVTDHAPSDAEANATNDIYGATYGTTYNPAAGSMLVYGSYGWQTLAKGTDGQVLKLSGGYPTWGTDNNTFRTVTAGGNTLGSTETLAFVAGTNVTISETGGAVTINAAGESWNGGTVTGATTFNADVSLGDGYKLNVGGSSSMVCAFWLTTPTNGGSRIGSSTSIYYGSGFICNIYRNSEASLSDMRNKKNIELVDYTEEARHFFSNINIKQFHYLETPDTDPKKVGMIAQDVLSIMGDYPTLRDQLVGYEEETDRYHLVTSNLATLKTVLLKDLLRRTEKLENLLIQKGIITNEELIA